MRNLLFILLAAMPLFAQTPTEISRQGAIAYEVKDYQRFLAMTLKLDSVRPMHPTTTYNLACAYALNGNNEAAFGILKRLSLMQSSTDIADDADFATFRETPLYGQWQKFREEVSKTIENSKHTVTLDEKAIHPEGLVYTKQTGWLAASVRKRKITAFDSTTGKCTDWLSGEGILAVFSLVEDGKGFLWAATAAIPEMEGYDAALEGKAEVLKIDIATKKILKRYAVDGAHLFGDIVVGIDGTVYVSDSATPTVYAIKNDGIAEWLSFGSDAFNLQGIALDEKSGKLFVADYLKGVAVVDMAKKSYHWMSFPDGTIQKGIDGLEYHKGGLIAIHNGVKPIRIMKYDLSADRNKITGFKCIDNNRQGFNEPVMGTLNDGGFYFFANSPWGAYDKAGNLKEGYYDNPELYRWNSQE